MRSRTHFLLLQKTKAHKTLNTCTGTSVTWTPSSASSASQTLLGKRSARANVEKEHRCCDFHEINRRNDTRTAELQHTEPDLVELVHSEPVDAVPLPLHGLKKRLEVQELYGRTRGEPVNTRELNTSVTQTLIWYIRLDSTGPVWATLGTADGTVTCAVGCAIYT